MTMHPKPLEDPAGEAGGHLMHALGKAEQVTSALNRFVEMFGASIRAAQAPELWDERIAALEDRLASRIAEALAAAAPPARPEPSAPALFMAQKAGFERLLIGFRVTLSQYSQHMEQMASLRSTLPDLAPLLERFDRLESRMEEHARLAEAAREAAPPAPLSLPPARKDATHDLPTFSAEQAISHRQQVGMRLLLRQFGIYSEGLRQATERLTLRVRALEEASPPPASRPAESPPPAPDLSPILERLEAIERRLDAAPAPERPILNGAALAEKVRQEQQGRQIHQLTVGLQLLGQTVSGELAGLRASLEALAGRMEAAPAPDLTAIAEALRTRHAEMQSGLAPPPPERDRLAESFLVAVQRTEAIGLQLAEAARRLRPARPGADRANAHEEDRALQAAAQVISAQTAEFLAIAAAVSREVSSLAKNAPREMTG